MQHNLVFSKGELAFHSKLVLWNFSSLLWNDEGPFQKTSISKIHNTCKLYDYFNKRLDREIKEVGAEKVAKYEKMIEGMIPLEKIPFAAVSVRDITVSVTPFWSVDCCCISKNCSCVPGRVKVEP